LNGSLAFLDSFAVANEDFIKQEEEKIRKVNLSPHEYTLNPINSLKKKFKSISLNKKLVMLKLTKSRPILTLFKKKSTLLMNNKSNLTTKEENSSTLLRLMNLVSLLKEIPS